MIHPGVEDTPIVLTALKAETRIIFNPAWAELGLKVNNTYIEQSYELRYSYPILQIRKQSELEGNLD